MAFYVTIIHRPEMVPEYIQKEAEQGKVEDLTRNSVLQESLDIFRTQQRIAHENGLRTTIQMTYARFARTTGNQSHQYSNASERPRRNDVRITPVSIMRIG